MSQLLTVAKPIQPGDVLFKITMADGKNYRIRQGFQELEIEVYDRDGDTFSWFTVFGHSRSTSAVFQALAENLLMSQ